MAVNPKIAELAKTLKTREGQLVSGARSRLTKSLAMSTDKLAEAHPDKHFRRVNARDPQKVQSRKLEGYEVVSEEEATKHGATARLGGEDVLMSISQEEYERRQAEIAAETERRKSAHKAEFERTVEAVARELRDKHGFDDMTPSRISNNG